MKRVKAKRAKRAPRVQKISQKDRDRLLRGQCLDAATQFTMHSPNKSIPDTLRGAALIRDWIEHGTVPTPTSTEGEDGKIVTLGGVGRA